MRFRAGRSTTADGTVDAYIGAYSPDKGYEIVEEYPGTVLDFDKVKAAVAAALELSLIHI